MKPFINAYFKIAAICVSMTLFIQGWVIKSLYTWDSVQLLPGIIIAILGSAGSYFFLYKITVFVYEKWLWRVFYRKLCVGGSWYHIIKCEEDKKYCRYGITQIKQTMFDLSIVGINYDGNFTLSSRSLWESRAVSMDENGRLLFTYQVSRAGGMDPKEKSGIMNVQIYYENKRVPVRLEGIFQDSLPGTKRGSITWKREVPWQDKIKLLELVDKPLQTKK